MFKVISIEQDMGNLYKTQRKKQIIIFKRVVFI
jgi:hypothetical protein